MAEDDRGPASPAEDANAATGARMNGVHGGEQEPKTEATGTAMAAPPPTTTTAATTVGRPPGPSIGQRERLTQLMHRLQQLRIMGAHETDHEHHQEYSNLTNFLKGIQAHQAKMREQSAREALEKAKRSEAEVTKEQATTETVKEEPAAIGEALEDRSEAATPTAAAMATATSTAQTGAMAASETSSGGKAALTAPQQQVPLAFTPDQLGALKYQIFAFKQLSNGQTIPAHVLQAIFSPAEATLELEREIEREIGGLAAKNALLTDAPGMSHESSALVGRRLAEAVVNVQDSVGSAEPTASTGETAVAAPMPHEESPEIEDVPIPGAGPYNALTDPFTFLRRPISILDHAARAQRMIIPSITPAGLDPYLLAEERERFVQARIENRLGELRNLPSTMTQARPSMAQAKIKAQIEMKMLLLRHRQRAMRDDLLKSMNRSTTLATSQDRNAFRRFKKQTLRDARMTEHLERKQRAEREKKARQKEIDRINAICEHGRRMIMAGREASLKASRFAKAVLKYHTETEKEEARRQERMSKERLRALKADDEEAYLKLIDTAKDTRITHLLKQTDMYLDSLAQAVLEQQNESTEATAPPVDLGQDEEIDDEGRVDPYANENDASKLDYYRVAHKIQEKVTEQPTMLIGGSLKSYQIQGLQWMVSLYNNKLNGILADEMGLGKTIQTISLIAFLIEKKQVPGPYLVIVPLSTLTNWTLEFEKWAPGVNTVVYKGSPNQRKDAQYTIRQGHFQVLLTTYEYIIKDRPILGKVKWIHMIIDEGHRMKNTQSKLSLTLSTYYSARHRLILTGTPLQNNLPELWALLNFVLPKVFNSVKSFDEWFNAPFANTGGQDKIAVNEEEALLVIRRLHKVLRPFLLRRLKKDVEADLPDKVERVVKCKMSGLQLKLYNQMKKYGILFADTGATGKIQGIKGLNNQLMQLRKICNHPYAFEEVERLINPHGVNGDDLWRVAGKFELLDRILPKFFKTGHRVLVFFQMTTIMSIMEDFLAYRGIRYLRLDGGTKSEDRPQLLKLFNDPDSEYEIFLLSTRAGGLGLNLQTADTVIIFDSDWNPSADLQAQDRAHRIGQKKEVRILRLITENSIEEAVLRAAQFKLEMDGKIIQAGKFDNKSTAEEREALLKALLDAEQEVTGEEDDEDLDDDELNEIIARNDEELEYYRKLDQEREAQAEKVWRSQGNKGPKPTRLIAVDELPALYQRDEQMEYSMQEELTGRRQRAQVRYDDGLTEEQFMNALENDDMELSDIIARKEERRRKRVESRVRRDEDGAEDLDSEHNGPTAQGDGTPLGTAAGAQKRKRQLATRESSVMDDRGKESGGTTTPASASGGAKKRKTATGGSVLKDSLDLATRAPMQRVMQDCYSAVENSVDAETQNRRRCVLFLDLPSKRMYPQYYLMIQRPIAMHQIKKKMNAMQYRSIEDFRNDFKLMFQNARTFNEEGSFVYEDAVEMERDFDRAYEASGGADGSWREHRSPSVPSHATDGSDEVALPGGSANRLKIRLKMGNGGRGGDGALDERSPGLGAASAGRLRLSAPKVPSSGRSSPSLANARGKTARARKRAFDEEDEEDIEAERITSGRHGADDRGDGEGDDGDDGESGSEEVGDGS